MNNGSLTIRRIVREDMSFIKKLWADKESMLASGGAYNVTDEMLDDLYQILSQGDSVNNHYMIESNSSLVGDLSIRDFDDKKVAHLDFKLFHPEKQKGLGKQVLDLILKHVFEELQGQEAYFELWLASTFVKEKLEAYGFKESSVSEDTILMTMTKEKYQEVYHV